MMRWDPEAPRTYIRPASKTQRRQERLEAIRQAVWIATRAVLLAMAIAATWVTFQEAAKGWGSWWPF